MWDGDPAPLVSPQPAACWPPGGGGGSSAHPLQEGLCEQRWAWAREAAEPLAELLLADHTASPNGSPSHVLSVGL